MQNFHCIRVCVFARERNESQNGCVSECMHLDAILLSGNLRCWYSLPPPSLLPHARRFLGKGSPVWSPGGAAVWSEGRTRFSTLNSQQTAAPCRAARPVHPDRAEPLKRIRLLRGGCTIPQLAFHPQPFYDVTHVYAKQLVMQWGETECS